MTGSIAQGATAQRSVPIWMWAVLVGSLAANMIVAGAFLGQRWRPTHGLPPGLAARLARGASTPLINDLTPEKRTEIRGIFERHRGENRALWATVRERRAEVTKALEAEPFDKSAYVSAMSRFIEAEAVARSSAQPTFADVAAVLSAKERKDFVSTHRQLRQQLVAPGRGPGGALENGEPRGQPK
jgi:uncharacterized membrane protein